jgi:predicted glutamine amidotransferase
VCGLVAFTPSVPRTVLYKALPRVAARGPHSYGWAWFDKDNSYTVAEQGAGPLVRIPVKSAGAPVTVGHSRLATSTDTSGSVPSPLEGQPLISERQILAHNGNSNDPSLLAHSTGAPHDSSAIFVLAQQLGIWELARPDKHFLFGGSPHALILATNSRASIFVLRVPGDKIPAHPLYQTTFPGGGVLVSSTPALASSTLLEDGLTEIPLGDDAWLR